jgi:alkylation response protein AidB-like acyl-CoA dehydrogenase
VARRNQAGRWRLEGVKWFTSATTAGCALALARPEGAPPDSAGLGLFLVERVNPGSGRSQLGSTILVNRLKDKLGTRALPTAELTLAGAATPVGGVDGDLRKIAGMLNVTRLHNAVSSAAGMWRGLDLAVAYAATRQAFGRRLADLPLHQATLADLMELLGRLEHGAAGELERRALRALVPTRQAAHRQGRRRPRQRGGRGLRRRRLRRGHRHPAAAARCPGAALSGRAPPTC